MKELNENIVRILEENNFNIGEITEQNGSYYIELSQYTPLGEDWYVVVWYDGTDEDFIDQFDQIYQNFDVDEELEIFMECRGKNGVPTSVRDLLEDQEWKNTCLGNTSFQLTTLELDSEEKVEEEEESETEEWKVFYIGAKEICAYTIFGEGAGEEEATKELLAAERGLNPEDITCYVVKR